MTCNQDGCEKPPSGAKGMCSMHYKRFRLYGDPNATPRFDRDPADRFWTKVDASGDCWEWIGKVNNNGYGVFTLGRRSLDDRRVAIAHRFAWESLVGLIPPGMQIDHLCKNRTCVNPDHLQPVTPAENTARASSAKRRHCIRGHEFTPENTYRVPGTGRRSCKTCRAAYHERERELVNA